MDGAPQRPGSRAFRAEAGGDSWATGRLLSTAARLVEHAWDAHLSQWSLNHASFAVLWMVEAEPSSQRVLARRMQVQDQTMSRVVTGLERAGYVTRARSGADRRRRIVTATDAGRAARRGAEAGDVAERLVADALGGQDVEQLRGQLIALVRRLSAQRWT